MSSAGGTRRHHASRPPYLKDALRPGDPARLGSYELLSRLGSGAYGTVYAAQRASSERADDLFAVKLLPAPVDMAGRARFRREVQALRAVDSRHVVRYVDHGESPEGLWLVTELLVGASTLASRRRLDGLELLSVLRQMLVALRDLHGAGVTHRDLHPGNVMITADAQVKIIDLGLSLHGVDRLTASREHLGHLVYTPPEQRGVGVPAWDPASDVFAWAATAAFAAQGRGPQRLEDVFAGPREAEDYDLAGVERSLRGVLRDCLEREPANRISTDEVLRRLRTVTQRWSDSDRDATTTVVRDSLWLWVDGSLTQYVEVDPVCHRGRTERSTFSADGRVFDLPPGTVITLHERGFTAVGTPRPRVVCPTCGTHAVHREAAGPPQEQGHGFACPNHLLCLGQVHHRVQVLEARDFDLGDRSLLRYAPYEAPIGQQIWHEGLLAEVYARDGSHELAFEQDDEVLRLHRFTGLAPVLCEPLLRRAGGLHAVLLGAPRAEALAAVQDLAENQRRLDEDYEKRRAAAATSRARWEARAIGPLERWGLNNPVHSLEQVAHLIGAWRAPVFAMWEQVGWLG